MRKVYEHCFMIEEDCGGGDTNIGFIFADSAEEVVTALTDNGWDITEDDLTEVDPNGETYRRWAHTYGKRCNVEYLCEGEFVGNYEYYDSYRDMLYDLALEQMEVM